MMGLEKSRVPTSVEIYSKSPLGVVLPPSREVYFWYDAFASDGSIAMCPSDHPPAPPPSLMMPGGRKDQTLRGDNCCSKGFPSSSFCWPHAILSPVLNALKEPLSWNGSPLSTKKSI